MKRKCIQRVAMAIIASVAVLAGVIFVPVGGEAAATFEPEHQLIKIGLYYGGDEMKAANLLNAIGRGYTFGYFDAERMFHPVGQTDETAITMLKDWTMYLSGDKYNDEIPVDDYGTVLPYETVGCYHIRLNIEFAVFEDAALAAQEYTDAFPAFHNGMWYVCVGSYTSAADAEAARVERGIDGIAMTASSACITVVATGTTRILFQFDCGATASLAVMPRPDESGAKPQTWFRNYKYYGAFQYTRLNGGNITVVNVVDMEDYIKGVIPYEMNTLWPLEALKAQAICARTYAARRFDAHKSYGFDLCRTVCCQTYLGTNASGEGSDRAVDETAGEYITYNGELCNVFYFSSDGGATENCENVFNEALPYLRGVYDPYEEYVETGRKNWSYTYTADEITAILQSKGYNCAKIVSVTPTYTEMGNIYSLKFTDANGKNWTFSKYNASSILYSSQYGKYTYSMRFTVKGENQADSTILYANSSRDVLDDIGEVYALGSGGVAQKLEGMGTLSVMTGSGVEEISIVGSGAAIAAERYVISGSGWGHNVGLSQYGAKAMAEQGLNYRDILEFYFTGVTIG